MILVFSAAGIERPTIYFRIEVLSAKSIPKLPEIFPYANPVPGFTAFKIARNAVSPASLDGFPTTIFKITVETPSPITGYLDECAF